MALSDIFSGLWSSPAQTNQFPNFGPEQLQALMSLLGQGQQNTNFNDISQQATSNFYQNTVPSIAERFSSMGGQRSGAFQASLGNAGAGLNRDLGAMRSQFGMQQLQHGLTPQFQTMYQPEQPGFLQNLLLSLAGVAPQALGAMYGASTGLASLGQLGSGGQK